MNNSDCSPRGRGPSRAGSRASDPPAIGGGRGGTTAHCAPPPFRGGGRKRSDPAAPKHSLLRARARARVWEGGYRGEGEGCSTPITATGQPGRPSPATSAPTQEPPAHKAEHTPRSRRINSEGLSGPDLYSCTPQLSEALRIGSVASQQNEQFKLSTSVHCHGHRARWSP
nr:MAG TPA: hypothetical protein [Caudoviricetes sp.]